ncbi:major facilitator superfamily domain-containing protein [Mycena rebaudengoi]|nr:major facilitator superfamily domain-containing protein [Mycena rebaudengoi]
MADKNESPSAPPVLASTVPPTNGGSPRPSSHSLQEKAAENHTGHQPDVDAVVYPTGLKLLLITAALCLSIFLVALDNTIIATAIPKITDQFRSLNDIGWYGSAYLLTTAAFQLLFGKVFSVLSIKWVFIFAILAFELGSLICGVAPNSTALIVGRAISGLGSAGIYSGTWIIVAHSVPLEKRALYTGLIGSMYGVASVLGPLLGGVFTDRVTWRWCFFINLPLGAPTVLFIILFFQSPAKKEREGSIRLKHFDPWGTLVFVPAIVCLLLALQWGGSRYPWSSGRIVALLVIFSVFILIFIALQVLLQEDATVPPRILQQRTVFATSWFAFTLGASFFVLVYFLPIWFQAIKGVNAVKSGVDSLGLILSLVVGSLIAGTLVTTFGYYTPLMIASSVMMAIGGGLITTFRTDTGTAHWLGYQVLFGLGTGFGMQNTALAVQAVLPLKDVPIGTSLVTFMQTIGGSVFVSVAQNVFTNRLGSGIAAHIPSVDHKIILNAGATNLRGAVAPQDLPIIVSVYNDALIFPFYIATALGAVSVLGSVALEWKSVKPQPESQNGESAAASG